jgi:putative transposase
MSKKEPRDYYSFLIPQKSISTKGIFTTLLGVIPNFSDFIDKGKIKADCRLYCDFFMNKYYLCCPSYSERINKDQKEEICSLDPGERIFMGFYGLNEYGRIGEDIRIPILKCEMKIRRKQRILSRNKNRNDKSIKNKKEIRKRQRRQYNKIKNIVKELHNKTALFLCKRYKKVLIPLFETQKMVANKREIKKQTKETVKKIMEGKDSKREIREYTRKRRLNGRVKFVLNNLSHYKFRQHLLNKGQEYGCEIKVVTEEHTSLACTKCGIMSNKYKDREKECITCGYKINRDINGARNILIKNEEFKAVMPRDGDHLSVEMCVLKTLKAVKSSRSHQN